MANIAIYNKGANPQNVIQYILSANTPDYAERNDVLINPSLTGVSGVNPIYWKVVGLNIVPMTQAEMTAVDTASSNSILTVNVAQAKASFDGSGSLPLALKAFAEIAMNEINLLRGWIVSFKAQVAATASLADLKTRIAGLPDMPDRTLAQLKTAIKANIDSGTLNDK